MRKSTQITIAYIALTLAALGCIIQDASARNSFSKVMSEAEKIAASRNTSGELKPRVPQLSSSAARVVNEPTKTYTSSNKSETTSNSTPELPRGVYLIKETLTVQSTDGAKCELEAGTAVSLMRWEDGKMKVSFKGMDFVLDEKLLTRNSKSVSRVFVRKS